MIRRRVTVKALVDWVYDDVIVFDVPKKLSFTNSVYVIINRLNRLLSKGYRKRGDVI